MEVEGAAALARALAGAFLSAGAAVLDAEEADGAVEVVEAVEAVVVDAVVVGAGGAARVGAFSTKPNTAVLLEGLSLPAAALTFSNPILAIRNCAGCKNINKYQLNS